MKTRMDVSGQFKIIAIRVAQYPIEPKQQLTAAKLQKTEIALRLRKLLKETQFNLDINLAISRKHRPKHHLEMSIVRIKPPEGSSTKRRDLLAQRRSLLP